MKPCCTPAGPRGARLPPAPVAPHATRCDQDLIALPGGTFRMGNDGPDAVPADGEGPSRQVTVSPFRIGAVTVVNRAFAEFVRDTRYITQAERLGASFVFYRQVPEALRRTIRRVARGLPWWLPVEQACWQRPEGPGSHVHERPDHPVVHVSWHDCQAYCAWSGTRLPTEAEWEYAARGGLEGRVFPWGDALMPEGRPRCNVWRGRFPNEVEPGWQPGPMPARAFEANGHGLFNTCGNVWEWCADAFSPTYHRDTPSRDPLGRGPAAQRSMRGGSFLCHDSYCNRYRVAARGANTPGSTASNIGFRVAAAL